MHKSVPHLALVTHPVGDSPSEERLRGLSREQLADRLTWLACWSPGTFTVVMDYMDFLDDHAADGGLDRDDPDDPAPFCTACGAEVAIFVRFSLNWQHYRPAGQGGVEFYDPGHPAAVAWRDTTRPVA